MYVAEVLKILAVVFVLGQIIYMIYYAIDLYQFNPLVKIIPLSEEEQKFISANFPVYKEFLPEKKKKCNERIVWFRSKKNFIFYGDISNKKDLRLLLSATVVIMTLGLKQYKMMRSLVRIIIYPTQYYSRINKKYHLGEYNPRYKTIVLSADNIWEGFDKSTDNRNLALHEFAHALSFEMHKNNSWEGRKFRVGLRNIKKLIAEEDFLVKLAASQYFREYGMTNLQEFFSVAVENYFETPKVFKNDFPFLFDQIKQMLQMDFVYDRDSRTFKT